MFCPSCGTQFEGNTCPQCGSAFTPPQAYSNTPQKKPKKKRKVWIGLLLVAIVIGTVSVLFSTPSDNGGVNPNNTPPVTNNIPTADDPKPASNNIPAGPYTFFQAFEENESVPYSITANAKQFLLDHADLFPAVKTDTLASFTDYTLEYKHLAKNVSNYGTQLMYLEVGVIQIDEYPVMDGMTLTTLNVGAGNGEQYYIYYKGKLDDIFAEDIIEVYALPLDMGSFENVDGGTTLTPILAGSHIVKTID